MRSYEFDEGYNAFVRGKNEADCPYEWETPEYYLWMDGYHSARDEWIDSSVDVGMY